MKFLKSHTEIDAANAIDKAWIVAKGKQALAAKPRFITDFPAAMSPGGPHDYYSNGDYWWPNPDTPDGLPYIRRDGETNPDFFMHHREVMRETRTCIAHLAAAYLVTGDEAFARKAVVYLEGFFVDERTKMNPHLLYGQAIPGRCSGRATGVIDTLHLIEVPVAIAALRNSPAMTSELLAKLRQWFGDYLQWMTTHQYGIAEMNSHNNHGLCWHVQAAAFALFAGNDQMVSFCRERFKSRILPDMMAADGGFPDELSRTKPYGYSIFVLDNLVTLCHLLATPEDNLWEFQLPDGRGVRRGMEFLYPYLADKSCWPFPQDVQHFDAWPAAMSSFLFAGVGLGEKKYIDLWKGLDADPQDREVRRNMAIRQPLLWLA